MKIVRTNLVPAGYKYISVFCFLFARKGTVISDKDLNHERIHIDYQIKEMLYIFFYLWYGIEFLIRWIGTGFSDWNKSYRGISFEQEAYNNEDNLDYLKTRKHYAWLKYI